MAIDDGLHPSVIDRVEGIKREFQEMARGRAVDPMDNYQGEIAMHYMAEEIARQRDTLERVDAWAYEISPDFGHRTVGPGEWIGLYRMVRRARHTSD